MIVEKSEMEEFIFVYMFIHSNNYFSIFIEHLPNTKG